METGIDEKENKWEIDFDFIEKVSGSVLAIEISEKVRLRDDLILKVNKKLKLRWQLREHHG